MPANPTNEQTSSAKTTIVRAGIIRGDDLSRLSSLGYDTQQARQLVYMLAVIADDEAEVVHVDERGTTHHFVAGADAPMPDIDIGRGIVVSTDLV